MQNNRQQRHSFKMTVGGGGSGADGDEQEFDVPPARPIRTTSYLSSGGVGAHIRSQQQQALRQATSAGAQGLGNKDLIIRMLAEIFQVRHDEHTGQVRWQQVSTSLVPISLYSRTTSRWLDYLLDAAQAQTHGAACMQQVNDPAAQTMSPDSRHFLLQLQQFHQQQQQLTRPTSRGAANNLDPRRAYLSGHSNQQAAQDSIVFQVCGHDFLDGQCRKILNVKIRQPGVRLGQASDYFVYWKELEPQLRNNNHHHLLCHQQLSASSFAESSIQSAHYTPSNATMIQMLNPTGGPNRGQAQTWGLNFASINDAKLFYDICSLNLVNLDFNSEYLKQLTSVSDTRLGAYNNNKAAYQQQQLGAATPNSYMLNSTTATPRVKRAAKQQSASRPTPARNVSTKQGGVAAGKHPRCPSCRQQASEMISTDSRRQQRQVSSSASASNQRINLAGSDATPTHACPVHGNVPASQSRVGIRVRSRSTTRQPLASETDQENNNPMRARSFSTPASPDYAPGACPVHRKGGRHRAHTTTESDDQQQQNLKLSKNSLDQSLAKPEKPARGLLRSPYSSSQEKSNGGNKRPPPPPPVPQHSQDLRALHSKRNTKSRYMGHLHNVSHQPSQTQDQLDVAARRQQDYNRSLFQAAETFDALARKDARLARALYANSRNMKEFLSLDAGGQIAAAETPRRLQRLQTMQAQQQQQRAPKYVAQSKSIDKSGNQTTRPERRLPAKPAPSNDMNCQLLLSRADARGQAAGSGLCSVATTTEDLPMDTSMKRRMLKLTSEEEAAAISEATEPKSGATSMATVVERNQTNVRPQAAQGTEQRQVRAISLGPAGTRSGGGVGSTARSDVGRRRSLERSTRIDQDPASSFTKFATRLSPLPQSSAASPLVPASASCIGGPGGEISPNPLGPADKAQTTSGNASPDFTNYTDQALILNTVEANRTLPANFQCAAGAEQHARLFSASHEPENDDASGGATEAADQGGCQMASHKSAPDIGRLLLTASGYNDDDDDDCYDAGAANQPRDKHGQFVNISQRPPNVSSYAVPLCTTVKRPPVPISASVVGRRQCRSCPNSLRRKRRPPAPQPEVVATGPVDFGQYCSCSQHPVMPASVCRNNEPPDCFRACNLLAAAAPLHLRQTTCCQYQQHHHHHLLYHEPHEEDHATRLGCNYDNNNNRRQADHGQMAALRPHSSQSVRSPTQCGLYESDDEDSAGDYYGQDEDGDEDGENFLVTRGQFESRDYYARAPLPLKPVPGYDRTLARAAHLKSATRHARSRSQPPPSADEPPPPSNSAFHLTKSMENVEKLIKEVQNELRALKRQPLLGTAKIDMKQQQQQAVEAPIQTHTQPNTAFEVSREEVKDGERASSRHQEEAEEKNNQRAAPGGGVSFTSATRRAGQFKCVGAIRKAGFLSVKKWILKRRQSIELARKQGWKRYWVCLRGTALLFHSVIEVEDDERTSRAHQGHHDQPPEGQSQNQTDLLTWIRANCSGQLSILSNLLESEQVSRETFFSNMSRCYIEKEPRHLIIIDGAIAQPIPEHPRRDFVFCLSTTFGDAYLFQASCQLESDNWISAIHNACAASIARDLVRDEAIKLFETKIKHFELEAEKKLFLRQRLESRLTSMSSMCQQAAAGAGRDNDDATANCCSQVEKNKTTMRSLLCQLSQQLLALDTYIEQLHCEVYQLRCYLSSCGAQNIFYQHQVKVSTTSGASIHCDLPNPKSLLMHVSKPTKLLLIKLGVFTVSSFHAYIHARQESAQSILLQTIQQQDQATAASQSPLVELRIRSRSISETLVTRNENLKLVSETENLIQLANLKTVRVLISKCVLASLRAKQVVVGPTTPTSDDLYEIEASGDDLLLSVKMNSSSTSVSIVKQVLKIIAPRGESEFLNYYLQLVNAANDDDGTRDHKFLAVKRDETLENFWGATSGQHAHLELLEKVIFRVELTRSRVDEELETTAPFGVSVEGQLTQGHGDGEYEESLLNVYCSYVEWGSVADKAGLQDEDEFLMINGVPLGDLDLMFVECIIQEASKLKLVVRSNRRECPARARRLDRTTWRSLDDDDDEDLSGRKWHKDRNGGPAGGDHLSTTGVAGSSQVISDEYLTSLVCPPPPARSSAFLRTDTQLLRQKSDLGMDKVALASEPNSPLGMSKSKSQHRMDSLDEPQPQPPPPPQTEQVKQPARPVSSADLARQLLQRSERLTKLLGSKEPASSRNPSDINLDKLLSSAHSSISGGATSATKVTKTTNQVEKLKKSLLELIETEYAYIRHLETIGEHYMAPLGESSFLGIQDLRDFNASVLAVLRFQHAFFGRLMDCIFDDCRLDFADGVHQSVARDHFERFNKIVQHTESIGPDAGDNLEPMLASIARTFSLEADKFRVYAGYCAAYSRLQRILHPKSATSSKGGGGAHCASTITSAPVSLNTFQSSSLGLAHMSELAAGDQSSRKQNCDPKQLTLEGGNLKQAAVMSPGAQLRKLADFLGSLDSSSSSASFSLAHSSSPSEQQQPPPLPTMSVASKSSGSSADPAEAATSQSYQKSVHQQNFESYLIKPIQRIVKYPMLLNSISLAASALERRVTPANDNDDDDDLQLAIKQMETVINHVNDSQRAHDEYGPILAHIQRQFIDQLSLDLHQRKGSHRGIYASSLLFGHHQPPISLDLAQLLYFGPVEWLNLGEFTSKAKKFTTGDHQLQCALFVFESCVVFLCKELVASKTSRRKLPLRYDGSAGGSALSWSTGSATGSGRTGEQYSAIVRYQTLIPVSEVQVRSVPAPAPSTANNEATAMTQRYKWELFQCSSSNSNSSLLTSAAAAVPAKSAASAKREQKQNQQKVFLLASQTNEERSAFLRKIRMTIRDSVRNMSLPPVASKSPTTSQNRSPPTTTCSKKLSTSSASSVTSNNGENVTHNSTTSLSPPESSAGGVGGGGPQEQVVAANGSSPPTTKTTTTTNKCQVYAQTTRQNETSIEINT